MKKSEKRDFSQIALDTVKKATEEKLPWTDPPKGMMHALASAPPPKKPSKKQRKGK